MAERFGERFFFELCCKSCLQRETQPCLKGIVCGVRFLASMCQAEGDGTLEMVWPHQQLTQKKTRGKRGKLM